MLNFVVSMNWANAYEGKFKVSAINEAEAKVKAFELFKTGCPIYVGQNFKSSLSMGWLTVEVKLA